MTKYLVKHGLITYTNDEGFPATAFRNMTVDIPKQEDVDRLFKHDAIVDPGTELEKAGFMLPLPDSATDEEILNWVSDAQPSEVRALIIERPMLKERIRGAVTVVQDRMRHQQELLSGVESTVDEVEAEIAADARKTPQGADPNAVPEPPAPGTQLQAPSTGGQEPVLGAPQVPQSAPAPSADSVPADEVILGNVGQINAYLAKHPTEAPLILEAENRRVEAVRASGKSDEQPRAGLVRAIQAASAHIAQ